MFFARPGGTLGTFPLPIKSEKDVLGKFIKQYGDIPAKMIFSANERRIRLRQRIQLPADGWPPYTALFRIAGRTMTTMEAGIIGGDDFSRLCEESSNQQFSGADKASLSQRLPASLRMRRAQGKSAPFCGGFSGVRNAARRSDSGAGVFLFPSFVPLLAFYKVVYKRKKRLFHKRRHKILRVEKEPPVLKRQPFFVRWITRFQINLPSSRAAPPFKVPVFYKFSINASTISKSLR